MCGTCGCAEAHHPTMGRTPDHRAGAEGAREERRTRRAEPVRLRRRNILALNLVSSPGAGKRLCSSTIRRLRAERAVAVIRRSEPLDAERIGRQEPRSCRSTPGPAVTSMPRWCIVPSTLSIPARRTVAHRNVGNLVCPAPVRPRRARQSAHHVRHGGHRTSP